MSDKISIGLCINRLNAGKEKLDVCELLYNSGYYKDANNRAYYSIFNSIRAILALEPKEFKKHKDVISYFNQYYVKTEIFPRELGHRISIANTIREDSDYLDTYEVDKTATREQIETAKDVSKFAENYIINWIKNNHNLSSADIEKWLSSINNYKIL